MTPADVLHLQTEILTFAHSMLTYALAAPFVIGLLFALAAWGSDHI